ncbi:MAG: hypothetical protein ACJAUW_000002 [Yoonia sp.]|jgi:hypothetical protein
MSVHTTFDNAQPAPLPLKMPPCVLRMAGLKPRQLPRFKMHDCRSGGDLAHIDLNKRNFNRVEHGADDWIPNLKRWIKVLSARNLKQEVRALRRKGRAAQAKKRLKEGPQPPWNRNTDSPLREGIITVNKSWFGGKGIALWNQDKVALFRSHAMSFLHDRFPNGQLLYAGSHSDEEAFHIHFVVAVWEGKTTKNRGQQILLRAAANPILRSYEIAQDMVGEHMEEIGITRGERHAEARRLARAADEKVPIKRRHVSPSEYREEELRKGRDEAAAIKERAAVDGAAAIKKVRSRASRTDRSMQRKLRKEEKKLASVRAAAAGSEAKLNERIVECSNAEARCDAALKAADAILEDARQLGARTVKKSRKRAVKEARARKADAEKLVAIANKKRTQNEDAAKVAEQRKILARNELSDARSRTTAYVELANEAAAALSMSEATNAVALASAEAARRDASQAKCDTERARAEERAAIEVKMAALAVKVKAEAAAANEKKATETLRADLSADRRFIAEQLNEVPVFS